MRPMAKAEKKIKEGAAQFLEPGEEVLAAFVARPRGWTQASASPGGGAVAGAIGGALGGEKEEPDVGAGRDVGFELGRPVGLAGEQRRGLVLALYAALGVGPGGNGTG